MVCYDGYLLSHTYMPFEIPQAAAVDQFLPPFKPAYALDPRQPANLNTVTMPDIRPDIRGDLAPGYAEIRHNLHFDLRQAIGKVAEIDAQFKEAFGRGGSPLIELYGCDDADYIAVALGSLAYQLRDVADMLREQGVQAGVCGIRLYRPFPHEAVVGALAKAKGVIVFEKALSYGNEGALCGDIKAALYGCDQRPFVRNYIVGLGGREIRTADLRTAFRAACTTTEFNSDAPEWIGLKLQESGISP
jgi:pyruvate/2-oxoacid:ferredoxin oxidoreductase alpha subunit